MFMFENRRVLNIYTAGAAFDYAVNVSQSTSMQVNKILRRNTRDELSHLAQKYLPLLKLLERFGSVDNIKSQVNGTEQSFEEHQI